MNLPKFIYLPTNEVYWEDIYYNNMTESFFTVQKCRNLGTWYFSIVKISQRFSVVQNCQNPAGTPC